MFKINSQERRQKRYERRQAKRKLNARIRASKIGSFEQVFSYHNLYRYGLQCCKGVRWKKSTQQFELKLFSTTAVVHDKLMKHKWKPRKCHKFTISERGKTRLIDAPHIIDRQVQKTFTREVLCKAYDDIMLYDNNASRLGKGLHFSYMRTKKKMREAHRKYGSEAGVIRLDLKSFFANAPLVLIYKLHSRYILDDTLRQFADYAIEQIPHAAPGKGLPLGVELSQQEMLMLTTLIDNYIVCQLHCGLFNRFMDDYIVFVDSKNKAKLLLYKIIQRFYADDIPVSTQKCYVTDITQPFKYCKVKFTLHDSGKITLNGCRDGVKRFNRKVQFMRLKQFPYNQRLQLKECCEAYYKSFNDNKRVIQINKYFNQNKKV